MLDAVIAEDGVMKNVRKVIPIFLVWLASHALSQSKWELTVLNIG